MSIEIKPIDLHFFDFFVELALDNYYLERTSVGALQANVERSYFVNNLKSLLTDGTGCMALENGKIVGYLAFSCIDVNHTGEKEATSPLYGYGIRHVERGKVIGKLFTSLAANLCEHYVQHLNINVYAHDSEVLWTYIASSFAMDTTDVVRDVHSSIHAEPLDYVFREVDKQELLAYQDTIIELYRQLINHLRLSPVFYHCQDFLPIENRFDDFLSDTLKIFAVFDKDKLIGMINAEPVDNGFAAYDGDAMSMGDVFIEPQYRGKGIGEALLKFANDELLKIGVKRLFVTHGTINPTARGFWDNHFDNFSYALTRQIDTDMLGKIALF
ncbi:GNAT family N-acetyltransferase [Vagococcus sp. BWB3-3]|uniref:GNAT family N-acetyltransferase n=1 Tax=Vagococcus allomyrinae TaxID=2794353 RepID=A0A940STJ4_9ENTE|nr:GNAT family N-acetyltransferase [Vagococcus allomyrinae]MBP1040350.1 GNAT family N-acetyltransferase [Vagococcus allomyrinae]